MYIVGFLIFVWYPAQKKTQYYRSIGNRYEIKTKLLKIALQSLSQKRKSSENSMENGRLY